MRLAAFDETLIQGDQSSILAAALHIAHLRAFPEVGIKSSVGVMQTAIPAYIAAFPLVFVKRILAVKWFFSALDILTLAWLYRAVRRACGWRAATLSALLYATNPWLVEFNRIIWYQTLVPTFATASFATFLWILNTTPRDKTQGCKSTKAYRESQRVLLVSLLALGLVCAALMGQAHLVAAPWAGLLFILGFLLAWWHKLWLGFGVGAGLSFITALPYLKFLVRTDFGDLRFIVQAGGGQSAPWNTAALRLATELVSGKLVLATTHGDLWERSVWEWRLAYLIVPTLLVLSGLWVTWRLCLALKKRPSILRLHLTNVFVLGWTLLPPLLLLRADVHLQHFYLLYWFPAPFVLVGMGVAQFSKGRASVRRIAAAFSLMSLLMLSLWWSHLWIARIKLEARGQLQRPARAWLLDYTAEQVAAYLEQNPRAQMLILTAFDEHLSAFDWIRAYANTDRVRVIRAGQGLIIPAAPTCYLLGPGAMGRDALAPLANRLTYRPVMQVPANPPWPVACVPAPNIVPDPLARWQNGLSLLETQIEGAFQARGVLHLTYTWYYQALEPREYHFFTHLMQNETLIAQVDGAGVPPWYWRDGDVLLTRFTLYLPETLPPETYRLRVGVYGWPDLQRVLRANQEDGYVIQQWQP